MAKCEGCSAEVSWIEHADTGRKAPVNLEPDPNGNVVLIDGKYRVLTKAQMASDEFPFRTTLHFSTCPKKEHFRRCKVCHYMECQCPPKPVQGELF